MIKKIILILSLLTLVSCTHSAPPAEPPVPVTAEREPSAQGFTETCRNGSSRGQSYAWCLNTDPTSSSSTLVYYFHGNGGSEHSWNSPEREALKALWKQKKLAPPMVVNVSLGASWFLSEIGGMFSPSTQDVMLKTVFPEIEASLKGRVKKRILMGESMGGYNAALLATKRPDLFNKSAIVCPAIYPFAPFISEGEIQNFLSRQPHVNEKVFRKWLVKLQDAFPSQAAYAQHDPIQLARRLNAKSPPMYILADGNDEFGFYEGGEKFSKAVKAMGVSTQWFGIPKTTHCGHSAASIDALARFLAE